MDKTSFRCQCGNPLTYSTDPSGAVLQLSITCHCGAKYVPRPGVRWQLAETSRQVPNCLRNLSEALDHAKHRVEQEILSCPNWESEDKEEWQRRRVVVARRLMEALASYL